MIRTNYTENNRSVFVEIVDEQIDNNFLIEIFNYDELIFSTYLKSFNWAKCGERDNAKWHIKVFNDKNQLIFESTQD